MDVLQKLKVINERSSTSSFPGRFYKNAEISNPNESNNYSGKDNESRFKEVKWFKPQSIQTLSMGGSGGVIQLESPLLAK